MEQATVNELFACDGRVCVEKKRLQKETITENRTQEQALDILSYTWVC